MCGIAGGWARVGSSGDSARLRAGLDAIRHRGPDDLGEFHWEDPVSGARVDLGLTRLAILDLSSAGHQPMTLPDNRFTISFNGEITNYVEIRQELIDLGEHFSSRTDTEVLLKAWARWGRAALDRLEGMFAFAVLDTREGTLTLVRDPFGIKPLFYALTSDRLVFNSELAGLTASLGRTPRLDWQTAVDYLQWGSYDHTSATFLSGVKQLRPGHLLVLDVGTGATGGPERYWWPDVQTSFDGSYGDGVERVRSMFLESVNRNLRSDVPLGIALSGGIDSSAIVGAVRRLEPDLPIQAFSFIAPGFARSEHEWIERVATSLRATSHTVQASPEDLEHDLDDLIQSQGEPFGSTSIYAQYRVFRLAREHGVVVTLDGQGGDELFAGYSGYPAQRMHTLIESGRWATAAKYAGAWATWPDRSLGFMAVETAAQFAPLRTRHAVRRPLRSPLLDYRALAERGVDLGFPAVGAEPIRRERLKTHLRSTMTGYGLPALLRHGDRNSMRFSIESRVPFLDRRLAEFLMTVPEDWLTGPDGTSKRILRDAVRGLVGDEIIDRRDKVGFETPENDWLSRLGSRTVDREHPIGFLRAGRSDTLTGGLREAEIRWGGRSHWRLINLRRWVALNGVDAS
ncbi:asparagine synthase (glutamine-hydrolyzing) [Salinibacterium sp. ZJ70]|uniref:asparagine synthase (glutamine-hydrolyzing) n=1 Tax=Salinibacterium sp. ZJ70 TaxID=2708084 RepID=UPI001421F287|nr:asparagine synthase (glutamine-hydrolyzing) [Salinibacterium sp. ZJ70]